VPRLAVFVSSLGMLLRVILLAKFVMMGDLMMMMGGRVMISGGLVMMLNGGVLRRFCHGTFLRNQSVNARWFVVAYESIVSTDL
jgi:hypothetical protein